MNKQSKDSIDKVDYIVDNNRYKNFTHNKTVCLKTLQLTLGNVSQACKKAEITRRTFYNWKNEDTLFTECVEAIDELSIDFTISKLHEKIREGNMTAIIFELKCRGQSKGYIEKQQIITTDKVNAIANKTPEQIDTELSVLREEIDTLKTNTGNNIPSNNLIDSTLNSPERLPSALLPH